jgi:hypothetical protein
MMDAADRRQAHFLPVRLVRDEDELVRRDRLKSVDAEAARLRYRTAAVLDPEHPDGLTLDVTGSSAAESAQSIFDQLVNMIADHGP